MAQIGEKGSVTDLKQALHTRPSHRERAYRVIRREILLGRLKQGAQTNERVLAETLGISRMPVREALLCLHGEGLISRSGRRGLKVTEMSPEKALHQIEFRAIIECAAARLAAERITAPQIERLQEVITEQEILEHAKDWEVFHESDLTFHHLILKATGNPLIIRMSGSLALGAIFCTEDSHAGIADGHRRILNALAQRRGDEAERLMYEHLTSRLSHGDNDKQQDVRQDLDG